VAEFLAKHPKQSPARSSYYGIVDLCGFPKDRYYAYQR
jgi:beta-galactosidase